MIRKTKRNSKRQSRGKTKKTMKVKMGLIVVIIIVGFIMGVYFLNSNSNLHSNKSNSPTSSNINILTQTNSTKSINITQLQSQVLPSNGFVLPAKWGDIVHEAVLANVINVKNLSLILNYSKEPLTPSEMRILNGTSTANIILNSSDALFVVDVLWGVGINNNNPIISNGSISQYNNYTYTVNGITKIYTETPYDYASTGGYGALGNLQLGKLNLISLTPQQQDLANFVAMHSYRPCCNNPTSFPDCNHGAAALALVEIMASQGNGVNATFTAVKDFNSLYFTQQYIYDAIYLASQGTSWNNVSPSIVTGYNFSSYSGASKVQQYVQQKLISKVGGSGAIASCAA